MSQRPAYPDTDANAIPVDLRVRHQSVAWRWEWRESKGDKPGKWTKVLVNPRTGRNARSNDPATWGTFNEAINYAIHHNLGVGYVFHESDPFTGIDFDDCLDPETGEVDPVALERIRALDSYTEISPSGRGVKVIVAAKLPPGRRRIGKVEMYDDRRFFTLTGRRFPGSPATVENRQGVINRLHAELFPPSETPAVPRTVTLTLDDQDIIEKVRAARNGAKFDRLYAGDTSEYGGDESAADLAFVSMLTFYTDDPHQIDRIVRGSGRYREKWERNDYRRRTIEKALQRTAFYDPAPKPSAPVSVPLTATSAASVISQAASTDGQACAAELARIAELERENEQLRAEVAQLRQMLQATTKHHSITERIHNNPGLTPAKGQIATNVVNEVASKISTGQAVDGWVKIRLDAIVKAEDTVDPETGEVITKRVVSKQTASRYIDELAEAGVWEVHNETRYNDRSPISDKYIRLLGEPTEALEVLSTIVLEKRKQGGSKKGHRRCKDHPEAGVDISRVTRCAECGDVLDEQHLEHVPAARFQDGTVETLPASVDVPMAPKMEPSPTLPATRFQHETVLERRQALRETRPVHRAGLPSIPGSLDDRIVAMVASATEPLDVQRIAAAVGRQPRDVREATNALIRHGRLKRWSDGFVTMPLVSAGGDD